MAFNTRGQKGRPIEGLAAGGSLQGIESEGQGPAIVKKRRPEAHVLMSVRLFRRFNTLRINDLRQKVA
jgi:hypothetical protein